MTKIILGIETSCDETAAAVVADGRHVLSNIISSQIDIHKLYGGVVPEVASRNHLEAIDKVTASALNEAGVTIDDIDAIAVTYGAGLVGALLVGVSFAKALSQASNKPLYAVNHIEGHICANYISHSQLAPPFICLIASGGHTSIVNVIDYINYEVIHSTVDDAIGEAFDKVARVLNQPYPGGIYIDKLSQSGTNNIKFTSCVLSNGDFSYSGLKTGVINYISKVKARDEEVNINDLCASFSAAAIDGLVSQCFKCVSKFNYNTVAVAGGVGANSYLRNRLLADAPDNIKVYLPDKLLCTDNAAMIASQGYFQLINNCAKAAADLNAMPSLRLRGNRPL